MKTAICSRDGFLRSEIKQAQELAGKECTTLKAPPATGNRSKNRTARLRQALFDIRTNFHLGMYPAERKELKKISYAEILGVGSFDSRYIRRSLSTLIVEDVNELPDPKLMLALIDKHLKPVGSARRYRERLLQKEKRSRAGKPNGRGKKEVADERPNLT